MRISDLIFENHPLIKSTGLVVSILCLIEENKIPVKQKQKMILDFRELTSCRFACLNQEIRLFGINLKLYLSCFN